jgi:hypothetical protein
MLRPCFTSTLSRVAALVPTTSPAAFVDRIAALLLAVRVSCCARTAAALTVLVATSKTPSA